jgi:hypothetical protein
VSADGWTSGAIRPPGAAIPGARYAFQVVHPGSPMLRMRYRDGIPVGPLGFPDWTPYARVVLALPPRSPDLGVDEARVFDVLTANEAMARAADPWWPTASTPAGWAWAHVAMTRQVALVPIELHGAYRHLGGVSTGNADRGRRGLPVPDGSPVPPSYSERVDADVLDAVGARLGVPLPATYRHFLARTNGARPLRPAVHPGFGFVADQPLFGFARADRLQDLVYANDWLGDRFTADFLAIGYVQGGMLAVRVRGGDEGSIWYWDDDDHRDTDGYTARDVCERLLHRCAGDIDTFWRDLRDPPGWLRDLVDSAVAGGQVRVRSIAGMGAALPAARRPPVP